MKRLTLALALSVALLLAAVPPASADPRMETNNNFCHFIMDPVNTDTEIFLAGCDATIAVVETPPEPVSVACENAAARGYGERTVVVPQAAIGIRPGTTLTFTAADSDTPCTMVESNGRAYVSHNWRSTIRVEATGRAGLVRVRYALLCQDGRI